MGDIFKLALRLFVFALVAAVLLAMTNEVTKGPIEKQRIASQLAALNTVLPGCEYNEVKEPEGLAEGSVISQLFTATDAAGELKGYALVANPQGYGGPIPITLGVSTEGCVTQVYVGALQETAGLGTRVGDAEFKDQFVAIAADPDTLRNDVDTIGGATISSTAFVNAVSEMLAYTKGTLGIEPKAGDKEAILAAAAAASGDAEPVVTTGTYDVTGFGPMKVEIAVDDAGKIVSVKVTEHNETPGFGADLIADTAVFDALVGQDIATAQIDVKAGATLTSNAINDALAQAASGGNGGEAGAATYDVTGFAPFKVEIALDDAGKIVSVKVAEHNETPGFGADLIADTAVFDALVGQDIATAQIDVKSGVTLTSNAINDALAQAAAAFGGDAAAVIPGDPYTVKGFAKFTMYIEVADGKISSISVPAHNETPGLGADMLTDDVLAPLVGQDLATAQVDVKSGVTLTSNAINEALHQAAQANGIALPVSEPVDSTSAATTDTASAATEAQSEAPAAETAAKVYDAQGFQPMKVEIAVDDAGKIVSVKVTEHNETPGFGADLIADTAVFDALVGQDIATAQIDVKTGVTLTSNAINSALKAAAADAPAAVTATPAPSGEATIYEVIVKGISKHPFTLDVTVDETGTIVAATCPSHTETEGKGATVLTDEALSALVGQKIADAEFDIKSGVTVTSTAINNALAIIAAHVD